MTLDTSTYSERDFPFFTVENWTLGRDLNGSSVRTILYQESQIFCSHSIKTQSRTDGLVGMLAMPSVYFGVSWVRKSYWSVVSCDVGSLTDFHCLRLSWEWWMSIDDSRTPTSLVSPFVFSRFFYLSPSSPGAPSCLSGIFLLYFICYVLLGYGQSWTSTYPSVTSHPPRSSPPESCMMNTPY